MILSRQDNLFGRYNVTRIPCAKFETGTIYTDRSGFNHQWDPRNSIFVHHELSIPQNNRWVEVSHCHSVKRGKNMPTKHYWTYLTPNSGIRMFTGKMIGFESHRDAAKSLNISCRRPSCMSHFHLIASHYSKMYIQCISRKEKMLIVVKVVMPWK